MCSLLFTAVLNDHNDNYSLVGSTSSKVKNEAATVGAVVNVEGGGEMKRPVETSSDYSITKSEALSDPMVVVEPPQEECLSSTPCAGSGPVVEVGNDGATKVEEPHLETPQGNTSAETEISSIPLKEEESVDEEAPEGGEDNCLYFWLHVVKE